MAYCVALKRQRQPTWARASFFAYRDGFVVLSGVRAYDNYIIYIRDLSIAKKLFMVQGQREI